MPLIERLQIQNFRNIESVDIALSPRFNVFYGDNAAGKTSVLEAIHVLGSNRSFRTHKFAYLIRDTSDELVVFSSFLDDDQRIRRLGVQRGRSAGASKVKLDGSTVASGSTLAYLLPLIALDSSSFDLIDGPPSARRRFWDWIVFHVKPNYLSFWKSYQRALKQRNMLLRRGKLSASDELDYWSEELCKAAQAIEPMRRDVNTAFEQALRDEIHHLEDTDISATGIEYVDGWFSKASASEMAEDKRQASQRVTHDDGVSDRPLQAYRDRLSSNIDKDFKQGFTQIGSHKNDIRIRVNGKPAVEVLSRGQKKNLVLAFYLAKARLFTRLTARLPMFLLDDLPSELDSARLTLLCKTLYERTSQIFITSISRDVIEHALEEKQSHRDCHWFHVKHGHVSQSPE